MENTEQEVKQSEDDKMTEIYSDLQWHSWKCRCGGLNGRGNANCGRCGSMAESYSHYYGKDGYVNPIGRQ